MWKCRLSDFSYNGDTPVQTFPKPSRAGQLALLTLGCTVLCAGSFQELRACPQLSGLAQVSGRGSAGEPYMCCHPQSHTRQWLCSPLQPSTPQQGEQTPSQHIITALHSSPAPPETFLTHLPQTSTCHLLHNHINKSLIACTKYPHSLPSAMQVFNLKALKVSEPLPVPPAAHTPFTGVCFFQINPIPTLE